MKKKYLLAFINSIEKGVYTLDQLYEEWRYFCESNILPKNTIGMFRVHLEFLDDEHVNIKYDDNLVKITSITIS